VVRAQLPTTSFYVCLGRSTGHEVEWLAQKRSQGGRLQANTLDPVVTSSDGLQTPTLVGRSAECELIESLLARARAGESSALVIRGEPGVGKTALLDFAASRCNEMSVLRIAGTEAESQLAFAGLFGVLRALLDKLDHVPELQAEALAGALGLAPAANSDRFLVSAGTLSLLAAAAEEHPILCVIDDVQWLDRPSVDALVFASRRLGADPVAMLFAAATANESAFDAPGLTELELAGLDDESAVAILDSRAPGIAADVRERLLTVAAGNPLALLELPAGLSEAQRLGTEPLAEELPLTPRLRGIFRRLVEGLPEATQTLLLVCALDGTGDVAVVMAAAQLLGIGIDAFAPAEEAGLVGTAGGRIAFRHPLVRSGLVGGAALNSRQRVHAALAEALSGEEHLDRRVWHQAMAALTGDEEVAVALEASARRAQERGGHASAATAFQRAAELTRDEGQLALRLAAAAEAARNAGQVEAAGALAERASRAAGEGLLHVRLLHLQGQIKEDSGRHREAAETLLTAARLSSDPPVTLGILVDAVTPALEAGFSEELVVELGKLAEGLPAPRPLDAFNRSVAVWWGLQFDRQFDAARLVYQELARLADELEDEVWVQYWAAVLTSYVVGFGAGLRFAQRAVDAARRQGLVGPLPRLTSQLASELAFSSRFDRAYATAAEGYQLALDAGQDPHWHLFTLARVEAIWGEAEKARAHLEELSSYAERSWHIPILVGAVEGLVDLGLGHPGEAADALLRVAPDERRLNALARRTVPDLIEALVRAGRPVEEAEAPLERFRHGGAMSRTLRASLVARCEALLGKRSPEEAFAEALELADALSPFERARTELLYGEWLRRERRRKEARPHLRAAADEFARLGARPWQERAEAELRATGETARKREPSTFDQLTPQELQIAQLAAEGYTNPDIAGQLFLSPRTIEYHLGKVFSKLGIAGRTELIRSGITEAGQSVHA
jgi:DNA-binding NarL/FixJ family response regulator